MGTHEASAAPEPESPAASDYAGGKWATPRPFVSLINEAAPRAGASVRWLSQDWIARLERQQAVRYVHGAVFPLNDAGSAYIAQDKVSTFTVLDSARVPAVPHHLVRFPSPGQVDGAADLALALVRPPLVIKPATEAGGLDVHRADSLARARALITGLAGRYAALAVCPLETVLAEHRVVMLDDEPRLIFRKELGAPGEWRHNLKHGARAAPEESPGTRAGLTVIARQAMRAIGARFMTVDVITTPASCLVLEVNSGVMLDRFAAQSPANRARAVGIYQDAISRCF